MTDRKQRLAALADRIEQLQGPDREVDAAIAHVIRWRWEGWAEGDLCIEERPLEYVVDRVRNSHNSIWRYLPAYTASLDAAMTLVPEGHDWIRKSPRSMTVYRVPPDDKTWAVHHDAPGSTPALALLAAALRAQSETVA